MEILTNNISTCPLAFTSSTGELFARTVAAIVTAHCGIADQWPADNVDVIRRGENSEYDFIVVGAGTAGSVVASRLVELDKSLTVLLIEAGPDPGASCQIPLTSLVDKNPNIVWDFKTEPDGQACLGYNNNQCIWYKGKAMGGSSSVNALLYTRGHPGDYNEWEAAGNNGWSYKNLLPYFKKVEKTLNLPNYNYPENPIHNILKSAWEELGYGSHTDGPNEAVVGTQLFRTTVKNGKRLNSALAYLEQIAQQRLHIIKNSLVKKIKINPKNEVTGVQVLVGDNILDINITKEVILSAGSIATPQLLMLSGIGPKKHLNKLGVKCLIDSPVGKNLQDHIVVPIFLTINLKTLLPTEKISEFILQYMLTRTGPFSTIGSTDFMSFINTKHDSDRPNIQYHQAYLTANESIIFQKYLDDIGLKSTIKRKIQEINKNNDMFMFLPTLLHPKFRGEVTLSDLDIHSHPTIKTNYLKYNEDMHTILDAIEFLYNLTNTNTFKSLGMKIANLEIDGCLKYNPDSKQYWKCYVQYMTNTIYHASGTTKMGINAKDAVVTPDLIVHGVKNLRVVDAGVMPTITGGNTMGPVLAIAEKAADIIKRHYSFKDEL